MIRHEAVSAEAKMQLAEHRGTLDPVELLHTFREAQSALTAIVFPELRPTPRSESLERFLTRLPDRWREEQDPAGRPRVKPPRHWRTRKDSFEGVWCDVLEWLQEDPDASAMAPLGRLLANQANRVQPGQPAHVAAAGAAVARHHGKQAGTPRPNLRRPNSVDCRQWRWRRAIQSANFSVTFFGEAMRTP